MLTNFGGGVWGGAEQKIERKWFWSGGRTRYEGDVVRWSCESYHYTLLAERMIRVTTGSRRGERAVATARIGQHALRPCVPICLMQLILKIGSDLVK